MHEAEWENGGGVGSNVEAVGGVHPGRNAASSLQIEGHLGVLPGDPTHGGVERRRTGLIYVYVYTAKYIYIYIYICIFLDLFTSIHIALATSIHHIHHSHEIHRCCS